MLNRFKKDKKEKKEKKDKKGKDEEQEKAPLVPPLILFVIDRRKKNDWAALFKDSVLNGRGVKVYQGGWDEFLLTGYSNSSAPTCYVDLKVVTPLGSSTTTFKPDFVLVRNQVRELADKSYVNLLYGFKFAGIPSINSINSIYNCIERPWMFGELLELRKRFGPDVFPLVDQNYYPDHKNMLFGPQFPAVVKIGHAHAGYGKMRIQDQHYFSDFASVVACTRDYVTAEPFYEGVYDLRIQKIGDHYRCYKRMSIVGNWKTNTGSAMLEEIPITDQYKMWADESAKMFGGLDILAVDAIHTTDGKEYILEVNDTSIGLAPNNELEDMGYIRDLVCKRMEILYPAAPSPPPASPTSAPSSPPGDTKQ